MKENQVLTKPEGQNVVRENFRTPEYRVRSEGHDYIAEIAIPGVPKSGVEIGVENDILTVTAHRKEDVPETWKPLSRELSRSDFRLKLELNAPIDTGRIGAKVEDGVLTLVMPVREAAKPRLIKVE